MSKLLNFITKLAIIGFSIAVVLVFVGLAFSLLAVLIQIGLFVLVVATIVYIVALIYSKLKKPDLEKEAQGAKVVE